MAIFKKSGLDKEAKKLSKTNTVVHERIPSRITTFGEGPTSYKRNLPVATVKEGGKKKMVVGKQISDSSSYSGKKMSEMPSVNITPKAGQSKKVVKTYEGGKLVMKEKQGKDIFGRPYTKNKTYKGGDLMVGTEKKTLTKSGIKTKRNKY